MNNFQPINQSSAAKHRTDGHPSLDTAHSVGAGFESVLRDVRRPGHGQDIATATGKKMPPGADLQKYALGPRVKIITSNDPAPDEQSLIAFARAEGIDESLLKLIMGQKDAPAESAAPAPDPAGPFGAVDPSLAITLSGLTQAPIVIAAEPVRTPPPQLNAPAAADTMRTAARPEFAAAAGRWLSVPLPGAEMNTGAPGLRSLPDGAAMQGIATGPFAMASAPAPGNPSESIAAGPLAQGPGPAGAPRRSPGSPPASAAVRSSGVGASAMTVSDAPFGQAAPVDAPGGASKSIEEAPAPTGKGPAVLADAPALPLRSAQAAAADTPKPSANAGQAVPDQTSQDASAGDGRNSPGPAEAAKYDAARLQEAPPKEALYARLATLTRPDDQKSGKSGLDATQTAALREIDAPAAAEPAQWAAKNDANPVSATAMGEHPQAHGGASQELDLGSSAPAREESMQDAYFRRSEQYQFLSDRVSEAIGQRLSAQIARGVWQLNLQLNPRHLGKIDIRLGMRGGGTIDAEFNADQQHTRDLLLNGLPRLKEVMAASGVDMANMEVKHEGASAQGGRPHARQSLPATHAGPLPDTQAPVAQAASHTARIGADGLDVMV